MIGKLKELNNGVPDDDGLPDYPIENPIVGPRFYTLKVHYGGFFDEKFEQYLGGQYTYIDYVRRYIDSMSILEEMMQVLELEMGTYVTWFQIPGTELDCNNVMPDRSII
ncbi:hypothetical protein POM88_026537 [Heracleum sosnowskyi]|uniref:Uncharacterized protein n=1 Tax=Heracleum sosnowskyi TaxID=360622 RepID=A0AAD8I6R5_9APIA|nr:hypothetical protein POM88_026537 [Heracleum sosnowskyi]